MKSTHNLKKSALWFWPVLTFTKWISWFVKTIKQIFSNFVCFSENPNFTDFTFWSKVQYATSHIFLTYQNPEGESIYQVNKLSYQTLSLVVGIFKVNAIRMGVPRNLKKSPTHSSLTFIKEMSNINSRRNGGLLWS